MFKIFSVIVTDVDFILNWDIMVYFSKSTKHFNLSIHHHIVFVLKVHSLEPLIETLPPWKTGLKKTPLIFLSKEEITTQYSVHTIQQTNNICSQEIMV